MQCWVLHGGGAFPLCVSSLTEPRVSNTAPQGPGWGAVIVKSALWPDLNRKNESSEHLAGSRGGISSGTSAVVTWTEVG